MEIAAWLGIAAGTLTTTSFLPQTIKVLKSRHTKDLSLATYAMFTIGVMFWFVYGLMISSWPIIISNAFCLPLAGTILVMKLREKK